VSVVLYRFDSAEAFPVLDSFSSEGVSIETRVAGHGTDASLVISVDRTHSGPDALEAVVALPPRTVSGHLEGVELSLVGDRGGCRMALDAEDESGAARRLDLGLVDFDGPGSCIHRPSSSEKTQHLQFHRLRIVIGRSCVSTTLNLLSLIVHGEVRRLPSGMAQKLP